MTDHAPLTDDDLDRIEHRTEWADFDEVVPRLVAEVRRLRGMLEGAETSRAEVERLRGLVDHRLAAEVVQLRAAVRRGERLMTDPTLTDEELAEIEDECESALSAADRWEMRLIAELRASRSEVTNLENQLAAAADVIADMEGPVAGLSEDELRTLGPDHVDELAIRAGWEPWMADLANAIVWTNRDEDEDDE